MNKIKLKKSMNIARSPYETFFANVGSVLEVGVDILPEASISLLKEGFAISLDEKEIKPFSEYEKQSNVVDNSTVPKFQTKEDALAWADQNGLEVDRRKSLEKLQSSIEEAVK